MSASIGTSDATTGIPTTSATRTSAFWERLWRLSGINALVFFVIAYFIYGDQPHVGAGAEVIAAFYNGDRLRILIAAVFSGMAVLNLMWFAAALRAALADAGQDGWGAAATASSAMVGGLLPLLITFVAAVVLVLLGGTTWASGGFWTPDGAYSRLVSPIIGVVWILVVSRILLNRALPAATLGDFVSSLAQRIASFPAAGLSVVKDRVNAIALAQRLSEWNSQGSPDPDAAQALMMAAE